MSLLNVEWQRLPGGAVSHALLVGGRQVSACGRTDERWADGGAESLPRCRRCVSIGRDSFAVQESELSDDAQAILAHARKSGAPFTRFEITAAAPGAAWDQYSRYPQTVAKLDPIRELVRAGFVEEYDEQPVKSNPRKTYKRWRLVGVDVPLSLAELLDDLISNVGNLGSGVVTDSLRAEILRRFA